MNSILDKRRRNKSFYDITEGKRKNVPKGSGRRNQREQELEESLGEIRRICSIAEKYAPDYDIEKIRQQVW